MALLGSNLTSDLGLRLVLSPISANVVMRTAWFPFYYHLKFAFLVWLQLPSTDGAKQLYMNHLRPFFMKHQAKVDELLGFAYVEMFKLASAHQAEIQAVRTMLFKITKSVVQLLRGGAKLDGQELRRIKDHTEAITESDSEHED